MSLEQIKAGYQITKQKSEVGAQKLYLLEWWEHARRQFESSKFEFDITIRRLNGYPPFQNIVKGDFGFQRYRQIAYHYIREIQEIGGECEQLGEKIPDSRTLVYLINKEIERVEGYYADYNKQLLVA